MEHCRWNANRWLEGYRYGPGDKNIILKTNCYIVPWEDLEEKIKKYDRDAVELMPEIISMHLEQE